LALVGLIVAAWVAAALCVFLSARHVRRLSRHAAPGRAELASRLQALTGAAQRAELHSELCERAEEADRALGLATLLPRSLARISLATGTAIALTSLAKGIGSGLTRVPSGLLEFAAGFAGMVACSYFGRQARALATEIRLGWRAALKVAASRE
jgi:hypothetical protein